MRLSQISAQGAPRRRPHLLSLIVSGQLALLIPLSGLVPFSWANAAHASVPLPPATTHLSEEKPAEGQPTVVLDHLTFPKDVVGAASFEAQLKKTLQREVYRADWGAGRENRIEYRFSVTELKYTMVDGALRAHCAAVGRLPRGQTAKSELTFSDHPSERVALTNKVLEIVARGVVTRLAQLERKRRGLI